MLKSEKIDLRQGWTCKYWAPTISRFKQFREDINNKKSQILNKGPVTTALNAEFLYFHHKHRNVKFFLNPLPPKATVTISLKIVNVILTDLPPSFLDTVTKYPGFFFEGFPKCDTFTSSTALTLSLE